MNDDDFLKQTYKYGIITRGTPDQIQQLREIIAEEGLVVVYQKTSLANLWVIDEVPK